MLYHTQIGLPKVELPAIMDLFYSNHAKRASNSDRYGSIKLQNTLDLNKVKVIEVETCDYDSEIIKVLVRQPYNDHLDLCTVISLRNKVEDKYVVKTVWLNEKVDSHKTLDHSKYSKPSTKAS